jgi:hypothetical protein
MSLPTPYTLAHEVYDPGPKNAHGNRTDAWHPPVDLLVHGWAPPSADTAPFEAGRSPVVRDLDLYAPAGTVAAPKDRITVLGDAYLVVGHPGDFTHGPWQWKAGVRIHLKRAEG